MPEPVEPRASRRADRERLKEGAMKYRVRQFYIPVVAICCLLISGCGSKDSPSPNPAPTIASLSTLSIPAGNPDFTLQIDGTGFIAGTSVQFDKSELTPSFVSQTRVTVTVPHDLVATARIVEVAAVSPAPGGGTSNALEFTIENPAPVLQTLSLTSILAGSGDFALTLTGSSFASGAAVNFGSQALQPTSSSATQLEVTVPTTLIAAGEIVQVSVTNPGPGGGTSDLQPFTVLNPAPALSSLSVESALLGSSALSLELTGTNFIPATSVVVGSTVLKPVIISSTQLSITLPETTLANSGVFQLQAVNPGPGGGASNSVQFTVNNPVPELSALSVDNILVGSTALPLGISGSNFVSGMKLLFGSEELTPLVTSKTTLSVLVPQSLLATAALLPVSVTNPGPGGGASNSLDFTVKNPPPTLTSLSTDNITAGAADFTLQITGANFAPGATFQFGSLQLTPSASAATQMDVLIPAAAIEGGAVLPLTVTNPSPGGGASNVRQFTIYNPVPVLTSLSQQSALVTSEPFLLDISGSNFVPQTQIEFGNVMLGAASSDHGHMRLTVPRYAFPRGGSLSLRAINPEPGGGVSNTLEFTVENPVPVLNSVSPLSVTAGGDGTLVSLYGANFVPGSVVTAANTQLIPNQVSDTELQVALPATLIAESGQLSLAVTNPTPGGGMSGAVSLVVHARADVNWRTVVNSKSMVPGTTRAFSSFNQPSINQHGVVVFKGQSKGGSGSGSGSDSAAVALASSGSGSDSGSGSNSSGTPVVGIYTLDLNGAGTPQPVKVADNATVIPQPNNTLYNGSYATYTQFPSFPRIDQNFAAVSFRAQHKPVFTFTLPDSTESRVGSAGVYTNATGPLSTAIGLFGALTDYDYMQVPGAPVGTRFDQFPGSPGITNGSTVFFKGNYTVGDTGKTGVYYRDLTAQGGKSPVQLIANSDTLIPNQPAGGAILFGSTAPPSGEGGTMVFVGLDNEDAPTLGGIYSAPLEPNPTLKTIVGIGDPVPGEGDSARFTNFGEGLSFDGRFIGFWGAWGTETRTVTLICPTDGEQGLLQTCQQQYPNGYNAKVPLHQGIFVYDMETGTITEAARTTGEFDDFVYWVFSGRPPGVGGGDSGGDVIPEPPRWRSSAFLSVAGRNGDAYQVAFKARTGTVDGIYLSQGPAAIPIETVCDTTMLGLSVDPDAPAGAIITSVGIERESLRGNWLVINVSMENVTTGEAGAGIYATNVVMH